MRSDAAALLVIAAMALVTYATRVGGLWITERFTPPAFVAACLRHTPGAVLTAIVAPAILSGGAPAWAAAGATVLVAARTGKVLAAAAAGVAVVWALRALGADALALPL